MNTEQLIVALSRNVRPVPRHAVGGRVAAGLAAGGLLTVLLLGATLGFRHDLPGAMHGFAFWMKWGYTASLALLATWAIARVARPATRVRHGLWLLTVPVLLLAGIGLAELANAPASQWLGLWLGRSWASCPWRLVMLAVPIFGGLLWSFRRLAPTRLRAAGAIAGLGAGAWAATVYCLYCPEVSAVFVLTWYSLGIVLAAGAGALLGPRLLRW